MIYIAIASKSERKYLNMASYNGIFLNLKRFKIKVIRYFVSVVNSKDELHAV